MAQKFKLGEINRSDVFKAYTFSYRYNYTRGNTKSKNYNAAYVYDLPFKKGKEFRLYQGYNGLFSHQNENALDFTMPEGTEIVAAREGVIVKVVQDNTENCGRRECAKFNNYITVYHPDGTFGEYMHIKYKGSVVKPGDVIKIDQFARLIELLTGREQVHVVCTVRLNPELELEVARQFGVLGECE